MKPHNQSPQASEFGKLISFLAKNGIKPSNVIKRIGNSVSGRTREEIKNALILWLKEGKL
jgi:hypothetical protein